MSHRPRAARRLASRGRQIKRIIQSAAGNTAYVLLAASVAAVFAAIALAAHQASVPAASGTGQASAGGSQQGVAHLTCGAPGLPVCQLPSNRIALHSQSAADIIAAARASGLFNVDRSGNGDYLKDLSHLEAPVLVRALSTPHSLKVPDYYVIPIDDTTGAMVGAAELELNAAHSAIHVAAIVTYTTPHPHGALARIGVAVALAQVAGERHTAVRAGTQPELIYFPVDSFAQATGQVVWNAGGEFPADPIWLIAAADGQSYVVGADGSVRTLSELPIMLQEP